MSAAKKLINIKLLKSDGVSTNFGAKYVMTKDIMPRHDRAKLIKEKYEEIVDRSVLGKKVNITLKDFRLMEAAVIEAHGEMLMRGLRVRGPLGMNFGPQIRKIFTNFKEHSIPTNGNFTVKLGVVYNQEKRKEWRRRLGLIDVMSFEEEVVREQRFHPAFFIGHNETMTRTHVGVE